MSRPGNLYAKAESFMKTLEAEEINGKAFVDLDPSPHQQLYRGGLQQRAPPFGAWISVPA